MIRELIYFAELLICIGAITGGILVSDRLRRSYPLSFLTSLFLYSVFLSFFAFSGIWGLVFFAQISSEFDLPSETMRKIGQLIPFLGFPFVLMGWYMFLRFSIQIFRKELRPLANAVYFILLISFFLFFAYFFNDISIHGKWLDGFGGNLVLYIYLILDVVFHILGMILLISKLKLFQNSRTEAAWMTYAAIIIIFQVLKITLALFVGQWEGMMHIFIVTFFLSLALPQLFIYNKIKILVESGYYANVLKLSKDTLFVKNGISRREKEIIECIHSGLTNQEIADKLFITLQTVKDHSHRIYLKMEVKNRMQLTALVNSVENED